MNTMLRSPFQRLEAAFAWLGRRRLCAALVLAAAGLAIAVGVVVAQTSPSFDLSWSLLAGGGQRQSAGFAIEDTLGQTVAGSATSANFLVSAGFQGANVGAGTATGDAFEVDDNCSLVKPIAVNAPKQEHTFHDAGDQDWLKFTALANKTYVIQVINVGAKADATIALLDTCDLQLDQNENPFGSTTELAWNSTKNGDFYVKLQQADPAVYGPDTNYQVSVTEDGTPPSVPTNPRCVAINSTTLALQWKKSPEPDVSKYRIAFTGAVSGNEDVLGGGTTYYELGGLTPNQTYTLRVRAVDYSSNESPPTGEVQCTARQPDDTTQPTFALQQPASGGVYSTTAGSLTFTGNAQDTGENLSRAKVRNQTKNVEGWDYSLTGPSDTFRVPELALGVGDNQIQVTVYDAAGNSSDQTVTVKRLGGSAGAVIIVAGHNETFGLQTNIYNATNRAYRIFKGAGYSDDLIYYIAPVPQDADGDGTNDVDASATPGAVQQAITTWASTRVGPGKPLLVYLMDHGIIDTTDPKLEKFCVNGCNSGYITPDDVDNWLRALETASGVTEVTVIMETCQSGGFIDRFNGDVENSLSKEGRVIITSTSRVNNAYASAQGALFSDAFFSCLADSQDLKSCFDEGRAAVITAGVTQEPWLDDNGDGLSTAGDGALAQNRVVTKFFSSIRPQITTTALDQEGANGKLTATVKEGAEEVDVVWAAVFAPSFQEPQEVTLNLNVPVVRLEPDPAAAGSYSFNYVNGFPEEGDYRIIFYAQDRLGIQAIPQLEGLAFGVYLPAVRR